ncbi:hypothetical protein [Agromyces bauzanensis]|uniref:Uncharacterized protein n=1 Tax=Agromyces bauzanensis TaxID=1308924 RepID=A0A917USD8_9MICO|nr:hypothetical protein [Agromyces bauzanensis]GGJ82425.1 hypothetical protein GCM10011372_21020 [Agromyces bauzanensis]
MSSIAPDPGGGPGAAERHRAGALDRIRAYTRVLAYVIIPFLVVAAFLLLVLPGGTEQHFAWTIEPPITAMLLGSAYAGGIWFFSQVAVQRKWHRVRHGFPAVLVFASLASAATFLHWDRFHFGHLSFITWVVLYVTTPVLVLAAIILQRGEDDGEPEAPDVSIPPPWRYVLALVGAAATLTGLVLFAVPSILVDTWAWDVAPLSARIVGAVLALPGLVNVWMLWDPRWSAFRRVFQAQLVSLACILIVIAVRFGDLAWERPSAAMFAVGMVVSAAVYAAFYVSLERRRAASL